MPRSNDTRRVDTDDCAAVTHLEAVVPVGNQEPRQYDCAVTVDAPPPALVETADIAGIFARSQAALDRASVQGTYSCAEQCLEQVWSRVRQRWTLIEMGLGGAEADTLSRQTLRYEVALTDAWQRFEGHPEEREALMAMYASLVAHMAWPEGFARYDLLKAFLLE